jgi:phosphonate transport system substrate-binding protein
MRPVAIVALEILLAGGCHSATPPPPEPPPAAVPKLVYGLALPLGPEVAIQRARASSAFFAKALGAEVEPRLFGYDELAQAVTSGTVDIAFLPPLGYVRAAQGGTITLLRRARHASRADYRAVLFTRRDSPVRRLEDLKGKDVAWVQDGSASGNLLPRAWMLDHGLDPATFFAQQKFLANHAEVCQAVYAGQAWSGASFTNASGPDVEHAAVDGCQGALGERIADLRIVFATDPLPNDVIAVRSSLSPELRAKIGDVLDHLPDSEEGRAALADGFASDGFVPVSDADFAGVRRALELLPKSAAAK